MIAVLVSQGFISGQDIVIGTLLGIVCIIIQCVLEASTEAWRARK